MALRSRLPVLLVNRNSVGLCLNTTAKVPRRFKRTFSIIPIQTEPKFQRKHFIAVLASASLHIF